LDHLIVFVASHNPLAAAAGAGGDPQQPPVVIHQRTYFCKLKKNPNDPSSKVPVPFLLNCGPDMTMQIRRTQFAAPDLWKASLKLPQGPQKKKKVKNHTTNMFGETIGRLHVEKQDGRTQEQGITSCRQDQGTRRTRRGGTRIGTRKTGHWTRISTSVWLSRGRVKSKQSMHDHSSCVFFVSSKKVYYLLLGKCPTNGIRFAVKNIILGYSSVSNRRKSGRKPASNHLCVCDIG
jgi:hypothetical protein